MVTKYTAWLRFLSPSQFTSRDLFSIRNSWLCARCTASHRDFLPWFCSCPTHCALCAASHRDFLPLVLYCSCARCAVLHSSAANVNGTEFLARGLASRAICYLLSPLVPGTESVLTPLFYQGNDHREKLSGKYLCVLFLLFSIIPDACVQYIHYLFLFLGPASMPSIQKFILDEKYHKKF